MEPSTSYYRQKSKDLPLHVTYRVYSSAPSQNPGFTYVAHFFSVLLVYRGQLLTSVGGKQILLNPGDIRIFLQGDLHHFRCNAPDTRYVQISLTKDFLDFPKEQYLYRHFVDPLTKKQLSCPRILKPGEPGYKELYQQMHRLDHTREQQSSYDADLVSIAISLCTALLPHCTTGAPITYPTEDAIRTCLKYMSDHSHEKITLEEMAALVHLHPNYLCALFKSYTGQTLFDYLVRFRVETAAQLLKNEELSISSVCELVGIHSESHFYRKFKEIMGISPKAYAKQHKKE